MNPKVQDEIRKFLLTSGLYVIYKTVYMNQRTYRLNDVINSLLSKPIMYAITIFNTWIILLVGLLTNIS